MKLISYLLFIVLYATLFSRHVESINHNNSPNLRLLMMRTFSMKSSGTLEIFRKQLEEIRRKKMLQKEREEAKVRKIINDHLIPLTKGNRFMKDFYSGRY